MGLFSPLLSSPSWPPSPRLTLTPPPTTTAHTATPDTTDTDTAEDTDTDTADTTDITVILMPGTEDTLTITASVPLMPNLRLRPRLIPLTCTPVNTAIPMPDTELTGISASVPLMLRPEHPLPTPAQPPLSLPVAPKAPVVSMASLMLMPPTTAIPSDTTVKLSYSWRGLL